MDLRLGIGGCAIFGMGRERLGVGVVEAEAAGAPSPGPGAEGHPVSVPPWGPEGGLSSPQGGSVQAHGLLSPNHPSNPSTPPPSHQEEWYATLHLLAVDNGNWKKKI